MIPHSKPTLGGEEKKVCAQVLDSLQIAQGEKVRTFERQFCEFAGRRHGIAVSSGTAALTLALAALDVSRSDQVILPSYACVALLHAVHQVGARPILVDADGEDLNVSCAEIQKKITARTKAVIVPHLFGRAARIDELERFRRRLHVIEDGTQALGAVAGNRRVGGWGSVSVFSFYATKMITTGEGGMIVTDSDRVARTLRDLRDYDKKSKYRIRTNSKMTDLEAAIGIEQLKKLASFIRARREIAGRYSRAFEHSGIRLPVEDDQRSHVFYRYVVRIKHRASEWLKALEAEGIGAKRPVFKPAHRYLDLPDNLFPVTMRAMKEAVSLPIFPSLSDEQCESVTRAVCHAASNLTGTIHSRKNEKVGISR